MSEKKYSLSFLNQDSYQIYNRNIARFLGSINAAVMLAELINRHAFHFDRGDLFYHEKHGGDWFYLTMEKAEERTCLSRKEQDTALKILKELGLVESCVFGLPAKRYFRLNEEKILDIFDLSKKDSSMCAKDKLGCARKTSCDVSERQTAPIYKNSREELDLRTTTTKQEKFVRGCGFSKKLSESEESIINSLVTYFENRSMEWGTQWKIPRIVLQRLIYKHGEKYVQDQIEYMMKNQHAAIKDENVPLKKRKTLKIDKPENYLSKSCKENWADSEDNISNVP